LVPAAAAAGSGGNGISGAGVASHQQRDRDERKPIHPPNNKHRRDDDDHHDQRDGQRDVDEHDDEEEEENYETKRPTRRTRRVVADEDDEYDQDHGSRNDDTSYNEYDEQYDEDNDTLNKSGTLDRSVQSLMLPRQLGLNAAKLHVMKASLFNDTNDSVHVDENDDAPSLPPATAAWHRQSQLASRPSLPLTDNWPTPGATTIGVNRAATDRLLGHELVSIVATHRTPTAKKRPAETTLVADDDGEFAGAFNPDDNNAVDESFDGQNKDVNRSVLNTSRMSAMNASGFLSPSVPRAMPTQVSTPSLAHVKPRAAELGLADFDVMSPAHIPPLARKPRSDITSTAMTTTSLSAASSTTSVLHPVGLVSRRAFRISWGPNGTMAYPCGSDGTTICLARLPVDDIDDTKEYALVQEQLVSSLRVHLTHYQRELHATPSSFMEAAPATASARSDIPAFGRGRSVGSFGGNGGMNGPSSSLFMDDSEDKDANSDTLPSSHSTSMVLTQSNGASTPLYPRIGASPSSIAMVQSSVSLSELCDAYVESLSHVQRSRLAMAHTNAPIDDHLERTISLWRLVKSLWSPQYSAPFPRATGMRLIFHQIYVTIHSLILSWWWWWRWCCVWSQPHVILVSHWHQIHKLLLKWKVPMLKYTHVVKLLVDG
jgi:hypothetical protein